MSGKMRWSRLRAMHRALAGHGLAETLTVVVGVATATFGMVLVSVPEKVTGVQTFRAVFSLVPPHVWGLVAVVLGVLMCTLLIYSRAAAAIPTLVTAAGCALWAVPIIFTPDSVPTAAVIYLAAAVVVLLAGLACLVPRERRG